MRYWLAGTFGAIVVFSGAACGGSPPAQAPTPQPTATVTAPTATPGMTATAGTATPVRTPGVALNHPAATLTGNADIDRVLDALFSGDPARFIALFELTPSPCVVKPQGIHNPPACPEGVPGGTLLPVFRAVAGEAVWPDDLGRGVAGWLNRRHEVYAIYRDPPQRFTWLPAAEYAIVLADVDLAPMFASEIRISGGKVTGIAFGGSNGVEHYVEGVSGARFVLPPR